MVKTVTVNVTQQHIDHGEQQSCRRCPVALATQEVVRDTVCMSVREITIALTIDRYPRHYVDLPLCAIEFIRDFDHNQPVQPFAFSVDIPEEFVK